MGVCASSHGCDTSYSSDPDPASHIHTHHSDMSTQAPLTHTNLNFKTKTVNCSKTTKKSKSDLFIFISNVHKNYNARRQRRQCSTVTMEETFTEHAHRTNTAEIFTCRGATTVMHSPPRPRADMAVVAERRRTWRCMLHGIRVGWSCRGQLEAQALGSFLSDFLVCYLVFELTDCMLSSLRRKKKILRNLSRRRSKNLD